MTRYDIPEKLRAVIGDAIRPGGLALTERAVDFCGFSMGARIVDIGCGFGTTLNYLRDRRGFRACGIDISSRMLSEHRRQPVIQAVADCLPFGGGVFDGVFCECVLSLLPIPDNALREFHRVLQPGGYLVLSDIYLRNPGQTRSLENQNDNRSEKSLDHAAANAHFRLPFDNLSSCLSGAVAKSVRIMQVKNMGFELLLWEDHSGYLKELAARIVWNLGSREGLMKLFFPGSASICDRDVIQRARPGYFLLIARKQS
jgi:arsenite methyltransferase